jgi:hypothetical protein
MPYTSSTHSIYNAWTVPVPASIRVWRVASRGNGLWVEDNDVVSVSPLVETGVGNVVSAYRLSTLLASMEGHMQSAGLHVGAALRNIDVTSGVHTLTGDESLLVEVETFFFDWFILQ